MNSASDVRAGHDRDRAAPSDDREQRDVDELLPPGIFIGLPGISSWSLPNAMFEPQKEIEPMIAANSERDQPTSSSMSPPALAELGPARSARPRRRRRR